jgi:hypothetical protein
MTKPLVQQARVRTNTTQGSVCKIDVSAVKFADIWAAYPGEHPSKERWPDDVIERGKVVAKKGELKYEDQCAIKVSVALHGVGVEMKSFNGANTRISEKKAALRAAELADWLKRLPFCGLPMNPTSVTGRDWQDRAKGKTGIIFFANYWRRSGESRAPSGDHIDLWNKSTLTPSFESFMRFRLGIGQIPNPIDRLRGRQGNWYSNLDEATEILLWEIQ